MFKKVNIYPTMPITSVNPVIRSSELNVTKPVEDIRLCLLARAKVEEITPDGNINLDLTNYNKHYNSTVEKFVEKQPNTPTIEEVVENNDTDVNPVINEPVVVETAESEIGVEEEVIENDQDAEEVVEDNDTDVNPVVDEPVVENHNNQHHNKKNKNKR